MTAATEVAAHGSAPTHCKVSANISLHLNLELRLLRQCEGKFYYGGVGGCKGAIPSVSNGNSTALQQGYATARSDIWHTGNSFWQISHGLTLTLQTYLVLHQCPRWHHRLTVVVWAVYEKVFEKSYFKGCSNGGSGALITAICNPNLFDGIVVRTSAHNWVGLLG